jgi:hypothetical protein
VPDSSRPAWRLVAALVLAVDGLGALALGLTSFLFANFSMAAVEGRTGNPNAGLGSLALVFAVVGLACLVAAWRIARGSRSTRFLGAALVAIVAAVVALTAVGGSMEPAGRITGGAIALVHAIVAIALIRWSPSAATGPTSLEGVR